MDAIFKFNYDVTIPYVKVIDYNCEMWIAFLLIVCC